MPTTLTRWRESVLAPFEGGLFPFIAPEIRVEQVTEDGRFLVRAEIPGVDPAKDVDVSVKDGTLVIRVERAEEKRAKAHSEFHYGRFVRMLALPVAVDEETAEATYEHGILQVAFAVGEPRESARHIAVRIAKPAAAPQRLTTPHKTTEKKEVAGRNR